jgi:hypothetical protein
VRNRNNEDFRLSTLCGAAVAGRCSRGSASTGRNGIPYPYYGCRKCRQHGVRKDRLEQLFIRELAKFDQIRRRLSEFLPLLRKAWDARHAHVQATNRQLETRIADLTRRKSCLIKMLADGLIDDTDKAQNSRSRGRFPFRFVLAEVLDRSRMPSVCRSESGGRGHPPLRPRGRPNNSVKRFR